MGYILDKKTIPEIAFQLKTDGRRVILTHGSYDMYHVGHLSFLTKSKKLGDILIVGVESDERVRRMKGNKHPIIPLLQRSRIIASTNLVDFVFSIKDVNGLNEAFYIDLYRRVKPDIVTYGKGFSFRSQFKKLKNGIFGVTYKKINSGIPEYSESSTAIIERITTSYTKNQNS